MRATFQEDGWTIEIGRLVYDRNQVALSHPYVIV